MKTLIERDLAHIWHPCSQMKDYEKFPPVHIVAAEGAELVDANGNRIIDAISSWWCKSLGHGHPRLREAAKKQIDQFEHVILANTTNSNIVELSEKLCQLSPNLNKVFYGGDGSTAVEIALKMSIHARKICGQKQKTKFMALQNGYHGETVLTLALGDLGIYKADYTDLMPSVNMIENLPYVSGKNDPLWHDCQSAWQPIEAKLNTQKDTLTAIVFEPILQGAGAMKVYSADFLKRLRKWSKENDVHLIADEILTGFGRTGKALACEHAGIEADFVCLSKGLTAGWMAMSAMLTSTKIYDLFYDDYSKQKSFLHSNTYAGNAIAAAVANEALNIYKDEQIYTRAETLQTEMATLFSDIGKQTGLLENQRGIGGLVAADLVLDARHQNQRVGFELYQIALKHNILLRPLGNTIYWLPPLNISKLELEKLATGTLNALQELKQKL